MFFDIAYGSKVRHCYVLAMRMKNLIFFNSVQLSWRYRQVLQSDLRGHPKKFQANLSRFDLLLLVWFYTVLKSEAIGNRSNLDRLTWNFFWWPLRSLRSTWYTLRSVRQKNKMAEKYVIKSDRQQVKSWPIGLKFFLPTSEVIWEYLVVPTTKLRTVKKFLNFSLFFNSAQTFQIQSKGIPSTLKWPQRSPKTISGNSV